MLEEKTEGKQIILQVLALDGKADFEPVRVAVTQSGTIRWADAGPQQPVTFNLTDPSQEIRIRLFQ
jgi:hypothetical protein